MPPPVLIKKYGNRRLYDTGDSRYITLDELATKVRGGTDVRVVDVQSGDDLTQATLAQIILESGTAARVLPVGLLTQLIRLSDDALAEFFSRYVTAALDLYVQARRGVQAVASYNPLAQIPMTATDALSRMWMASPFGQFAGATRIRRRGRPPPGAPPPARARAAAAGPGRPAPAASPRRAAARGAQWRARGRAARSRKLERTMREAAPALGKPGARPRKRRGRLGRGGPARRRRPARPLLHCNKKVVDRSRRASLGCAANPKEKTP